MIFKNSCAKDSENTVILFVNFMHTCFVASLSQGQVKICHKCHTTCRMSSIAEMFPFAQNNYESGYLSIKYHFDI